MEPDILASPGELVGGRSTTAVDSTRLRAAVPPPAAGSAMSQSGAPFVGSTATDVAAHGFAAPVGNGHVAVHGGNGVNGYRNGHGHAVVNGLSWSVSAAPMVVAPHMAEILDAIDARGHDGLYLRWGKRVLDVAGALVGLVLTAPLVALAALVVKLESRGPILYRSIRIGRGGRPFVFLKLRSMVQDADRHRHTLSHLNECDGPVFKINRDPRVTRIGRFLRSTSIDEIPQLLNVLRGEMSLVGPRPPIPEEVSQYEPWQLRRLDVLPGLTCLWQISGRSRIGFQEWMRLDLEYIKRRSFALDVQILLRTIPAVLSREGAY